jgi:hypothetical protein
MVNATRRSEARRAQAHLTSRPANIRLLSPPRRSHPYPGPQEVRPAVAVAPTSPAARWGCARLIRRARALNAAAMELAGLAPTRVWKARLWLTFVLLPLKERVAGLRLRTARVSRLPQRRAPGPLRERAGRFHHPSRHLRERRLRRAAAAKRRRPSSTWGPTSGSRCSVSISASPTPASWRSSPIRTTSRSFAATSAISRAWSWCTLRWAASPAPRGSTSARRAGVLGW